MATSQPDSGVIGTFTSTPTPFSFTGPTNTPTQGTFKGLDSNVDLVATDLEVTQGIQDLQNHMPLVQGRWTVVRLYLSVPAAKALIPNVKGAIGGWHGTTFLGIIYPENDPIDGWDYGGRREVLDESLWFYVPQSWREGTLKLKGVVYQGSPGNMQFEPDQDNNYIEVTVSFQHVDPLYIRLVPEHVHEDYDGAKPETTFVPEGNEDTIAFVLADTFRHLPIFEMFYDPSLSFPVIFEADGELLPFEYTGPVFPLGHALGTEWDFTPTDGQKFGDWKKANAQVDNLRDLSADPWGDWFWYGMLDQDMNTSGAGWTWSGLATNGVSSGKFGKKQSDSSPWFMDYGLTLSHELAHVVMEGAAHVLCDGDEEGGGGIDPSYPYPVTDSTPCSMAAIDVTGYYGFDVYWSLWSQVLSGPEIISNDPADAEPQRGFPLMGYESPQWADPYDYCKMLVSFGLSCDPSMVLRREDQVRFAAAEPPGHAHTSRHVSPRSSTLVGQSPLYVVHVQGAADLGARTGSIDSVLATGSAPAGPVDDSRRRLGLMAAEPSGTSLEFLDAAGIVLESYPLANLDPAPHGESTPDSTVVDFGEWFEVPPRAVAIELRLPGLVLVRRSASSGAPSVKLVSPNGGNVAAPVTLEWQGTDPDGDRLLYTVLYSPDDGVNWRPILANIEHSKVTLTSLLPLSGSARARFKVIASDGFNSAEDSSDQLVTVPDLAPFPTIFGPARGSTFPAGASVVFTGTAFDMEELGLPVQGLTWESDRDGLLGDGSEIMTRTLSVGIHRVTLRARDGAGNIGSATVTIEITASGARQLPGEDVTAELTRLFGESVDGEDGSRAVWWVLGGTAAVMGLGMGGAAFWMAKKRGTTPPTPPVEPL